MRNRQARLLLEMIDHAFGAFNLVREDFQPCDKTVHLLLAEADFPAKRDDVLRVFRQLRAQCFPLLGFHGLGFELLAQDFIAVVEKTDSGDQPEHSVFMIILLHESFFIFDVVHHIFDADFPGFQLFADAEHFVDGNGQAENGPHGFAGALFDFLGDLDFAFTAQERNQPHFPQVHLDRIAGFSHAGNQRESFREFGRQGVFHRLFHHQFFPLLHINDVDVFFSKQHDNIIDLLRGIQICRQHVIHVIIG